jgi:hypothetical protein
MNCYLDASGKPDPQRPGYFVLVCVFYGINTPDAQSATEVAVKGFSGEGGQAEVHFSRMRFRQREAFSRLLEPLPFCYSSFVANTKSIINPIAAIGNQADALLSVAITTVFRNAAGLHYPHIIMDRDTSPAVAARIRRRLNHALPKNLTIHPTVSGFELADSVDHPSIQIADFVAGIIWQRHFPSCKPTEQPIYSVMYETLRSKGREASWNLMDHQPG